MNRPAGRRRRRRSDGRGGYLFGAAVYALLLFGVNSWPGWDSIPLLTDSASSLLWLVNLSLGIGLLAQIACVFDDTSRLQALGVYAVALVNFTLVGSVMLLLPFSFGDADPAWATATRLALAILLVWAFVRAIRSAVRLSFGRHQVRLARGCA